MTGMPVVGAVSGAAGNEASHGVSCKNYFGMEWRSWGSISGVSGRPSGILKTGCGYGFLCLSFVDELVALFDFEKKIYTYVKLKKKIGLKLRSK